jgi:DNA-binding CsgD family transcriptional regulator
MEGTGIVKVSEKTRYLEDVSQEFSGQLDVARQMLEFGLEALLVELLQDGQAFKGIEPLRLEKLKLGPVSVGDNNGDRSLCQTLEGVVIRLDGVLEGAAIDHPQWSEPERMTATCLLSADGKYPQKVRLENRFLGWYDVIFQQKNGRWYPEVQPVREPGTLLAVVEQSQEIVQFRPRLTKRQTEVLSLIGQGLKSWEAAEELVVSKRTIDFHLANIYDRLQVNNRVQALRAATRLGLIPFEPE